MLLDPFKATLGSPGPSEDSLVARMRKRTASFEEAAAGLGGFCLGFWA